MKRATQSDSRQAQDVTTDSAKTAHPRQALTPDGSLAQLTTLINNSPRSNALAQSRQNIGQSSRMQNTMQLAAEINQQTPPQPSAVPRTDPAATLESGNALPAIQKNNNDTASVKGEPGITSNVRQFWGERWYQHLGNQTHSDGSKFKGRTLGLPTITGWLQMKEKHEGLDVYISTEDFAKWNDPDKLSQIIDPTGIYDAMRERLAPIEEKFVALERSPEVRVISHAARESYGTISEHVTLENANLLKKRTLEFEQKLGDYLKDAWTPVKLVLGVLGLGVLAGGGMLLTLIKLPWWLVMSVEGLSFIYGAYLLYRWAKSDLLPTTIKTVLLITNGIAMGSLVAFTLYDIIGYYTGLIASAPFQHIHFAAIPFALLIEYGIVRFIEKLKAMHDAASDDRSSV